MSAAPSVPSLETVRRETIDRLIAGYGHGNLSLEVFERRLDRALDAADSAALEALTADLGPVAVPEAARHWPGVDIEMERGAPRDVEQIVHVFGSSNRRGAWTVAREIRMLNVFGGGELDFTAARFSSRVTRIKLICIFGGATIYVPEGVNTVANAVCIFGGIDNRGPQEDGVDRPTLIIEGLMLFGGTTIRVKKPLKDRLLEFASSLRQMLGAR